MGDRLAPARRRCARGCSGGRSRAAPASERVKFVISRQVKDLDAGVGEADAKGHQNFCVIPSLFRRKKEEPPAEAPNPFLELGAALGGVALETASLAASAALAAVSDSATDAETSEVETATQEEEASDEAATEDEEATADADETEEVEVEASSPAKKGSKSLSQAWDDLFGFEAKE